MEEKKIYPTKDESIKDYQRYIQYHIEMVNKAFIDFGEFLCKQLIAYYEDKADKRNGDPFDHLYNAVKAAIQRHDNSKFDNAEFEGYRAYFYPCVEDTDKEAIKKNFDSAWIHHYFHNCHHPEFWRSCIHGETYITPMIDEAIIEMFCDWIAMSLQNNSSPFDWYTKNTDELKEKMDDETFDKVSYLMQKLTQVYN